MNINKLEYCPQIYENGNHVIFVSKNIETKMTELKIRKKSDFDEGVAFKFEGVGNSIYFSDYKIFINSFYTPSNSIIDLKHMTISSEKQEYHVIHKWENNRTLGINKKTCKSCIIDEVSGKINTINVGIDKNIVPTDTGLLIPNLEENLIHFLHFDGIEEKWTIPLELVYNNWLHAGDYLILWRTKGHAIHYDEDDSLIIIDITSGKIKYDLKIDANQVLAHETEDQVLIKQGSKLLIIDLKSGQVKKEKVVDIASSRKEYKSIVKYTDSGIYYGFIDLEDSRIGKINNQTLESEWEYNLESNLGKGLNIQTWIILPNGKHLINNRRQKNPITFVLEPEKTGK